MLCDAVYVTRREREMMQHAVCVYAAMTPRCPRKRDVSHAADTMSETRCAMMRDATMMFMMRARTFTMSIFDDDETLYDILTRA